MVHIQNKISFLSWRKLQTNFSEFGTFSVIHDNTPNFFPNFKSSVLGLSNDVLIVSKLWETGEN